MLSKRPYLIRALYDWTVDQGHVPIIVVDATVSRVQVPQAHVEEGHIHLNISPNAVRYFTMDRSAIAFEARFGGRPESIYVPMRAVIGIYDRDSGSGAQFPPEPDEEFVDDDDIPDNNTSRNPGLSLAESNKSHQNRAAHHLSETGQSAGKSSSETDDDPDHDPDNGPGSGNDPRPPASGGKKGKVSRLRIVK